MYFFPVPVMHLIMTTDQSEHLNKLN